MNHHTQSMPHHHLKPWLVCFAASLFFFYEFVQMSMFNAVSRELMYSFHTDATHLGLLSSSYFYANVIFMLPAGMLLDRLSAKKLIIIAMGLCVLGTVLFSFAHTLTFAAFCRFLTGIGGSFPFLACLRLASRWFHPKRMALVTGCIVTMAMLGGLCAQTPLSILTDHFGWRHALQIDALLGVVFIGIIFLAVQDYPDNYKPTEDDTEPKNRLFINDIKEILSNFQNWGCGFYTCLLNMAISLLAQNWGTLYLMQARHFQHTQASNISSMIFFGTIIGSPVIGWLSDNIGLRKIPMVVCALIAIALTLAIIYVSHATELTFMILFFTLGFCTSSQILGYPTITESNSLVRAGGALGLASVIIMAGQAVFDPLFGRVLDYYWTGHMVDGVRLYDHHAFNHALWLLPVTFLVGLILVLFVKETFCKNLVKPKALHP